jgi:hypothetical protein
VNNVALAREKLNCGHLGGMLANHALLVEKNLRGINAEHALIHVNVSVVVLAQNGEQQFANNVPLVVHASVPHTLKLWMLCNCLNGRMVAVITATARFDCMLKHRTPSH